MQHLTVAPLQSSLILELSPNLSLQKGKILYFYRVVGKRTQNAKAVAEGSTLSPGLTRST